MIYSILYSGATNTHLCYLVDLHSQIEWSCLFDFQPLSHCQSAEIMGLVYHQLAEGVVGTYRLTAHSFVAISLIIGLIIFTPGTQLSIYILLIPVILEHWPDSSSAGWPQLLIL